MTTLMEQNWAAWPFPENFTLYPRAEPSETVMGWRRRGPFKCINPKCQRGVEELVLDEDGYASKECACGTQYTLATALDCDVLRAWLP